MLTIGAFSRLTQIPAKTLRYYDEIGLFKPAQVDQFTQYRYYSMAQLPRLYRIVALKALGLTLEEISNMLDDDLSIEEMRGMLRLKQAELNRAMQEVQQRLAYVEMKIQQLERDGQMSHYDVILKEIPDIKVAIARDTSPEKAALGFTLTNLFRDIRDFMTEKGISPAGAGFTLYLDEEYRETQINVGAAYPIDADVTGAKNVSIETLPARTMASVVHHGMFEKMGNAYDALIHWIESNDYQIIGSPREIALKYIPKGDPNDFVTEIQFPVTKIQQEA